MDDPILIVALVSTSAFLLYMFFGEVLGDGADASSDGGSWDVLQFISIQSLLIATMSFSWAWLYLADWNVTMRALGTIAIGLAFSALSVYAMVLLKKLNTPVGIKQFKPEYGMKGVVYLTIPASHDDFGTITVLDKALGDIELLAKSFEGPIPVGTEVTVIEILSDKAVVVRPPRA